eukprot:TRINITY_DN75143_c0_g1_i1.p1 TRINITY_DN75143_c0_g1~~TRINITY_DN75143_c0_g1_i1.p1  ORF type:complete len:527 (+),score=79.25 TRINITY_DN75143_c0_g1_i1:32-1612(+)
MQLLLLLCLCFVAAGKKPNIVFIVSDDLGWDDVGFRSHQINTPNIDYMHHNGVTLNQYYVQDVCSPSRSTFMSGLFPLHNSINDWIPYKSSYGLPLNITTTADKMNEAGYESHAVGKWHLGFYKWGYTPTYRGFKSFYGFYGGGQDYFTHVAEYYDFRFDNGTKCGPGCSKVAWEAHGTYSTEAFTTRAVDIINTHNQDKPLFLYLAYQAVHAPSEVPHSYVVPYIGKIHDHHRRIFAGMLSCMDEGIGNVTKALKKVGMYDNTLFVFTTDNGGPMPDSPGGDYVGSRNWPLRGGKHSIWEGGTRGTSVVYGKGINKKPYTNQNLMHGVDWLPTLLSATGTGVKPPPGIDGVDQWDSISNNGSQVRDWILYGRHDDAKYSNYDDGIRVGDWKLLRDWGGLPDDWTPPVNASMSTRSASIPAEPDFEYDAAAAQAAQCLRCQGTSCIGEKKTRTPKLFNVALGKDPDERSDVAKQNPDKVKQLLTRLDTTLKTGVPTAHDDPSCPKPTHPENSHLHLRIWEPWCGVD